MPSLGSILQIAKSGLAVQQQAMNVTAHNIANASTDGYSRQQAVIRPNTGIFVEGGMFGTGAHIADVRQVRDRLLDGVYFRETSASSERDARADMLARVEGIVAEPGELGLGAAMDAFHSAWSELASNPANATVRSVVRQSANVLTQRFNELSGGVGTIRQEVESRLADSAENASTLGAEIARLNQQIVTIEADGHTAGDLRDTRASALARLSDLLPIQVTERENGSVGVNSSGIGIIDGANSLDLEVRTSGGTVGLAAVGRAGSFPQIGGRMGGLLTVINSDLPDIQTWIDDLAGAFVTEVNALHETGTNPDGNTGISFFDPAGVTASSISLSSDVLASTSAIAAGTPDGLGAYRAGVNDIALALGGLRDVDAGSLGRTMGEHYRGLVSDIGQAVRSSSDAAQSHRMLAEQADARRLSLSGVSIDEELVKMIEFQTAYQASARVVTAADELMQTLLAV